MSNTLEFLYDFGSPNAYLAHRVLPAIEQRLGRRFDYVPVLLGGVFKLTGNRSPMEANAGIANKMDYEWLEMRRFITRHGLDGQFQLNPHFPVNTLQIMRGAVAARRREPALYQRYIDTVFNAMWRDGQKMDEPGVITAVLEKAGLPAAELMAAIAEPEVKTALVETTRRAVDRGVFGIPSYFAGDELYFGKDRLRDVEEAAG
ncbi:MAG: 2-hydroxychromene-2-carboxylate isomerase [Parahaliea sp.]